MKLRRLEQVHWDCTGSDPGSALIAHGTRTAQIRTDGILFHLFLEKLGSRKEVGKKVWEGFVYISGIK